MLSLCFPITVSAVKSHLCVMHECQLLSALLHKLSQKKVKMKHCYIPSISSKNSTVLQAYNTTCSQNTSPQNLYTILIWIICRGVDSCGVFASFSSHKDFLLLTQIAPVLFHIILYSVCL